MKTIKNKCGADGGTRNHAEAITIEDMRTLMDWSQSKYPSETLDSLMDTEELKSGKMHALMRAFMASGFTLWTR